MGKGPCLCGDLYCSSCGDPSRAAQEDALENLTNLLSDLHAPVAFINMLHSMLPDMLSKWQVAVDDEVRDKLADDQQYISYLKDEVERLKHLNEEYNQE